MSAGDTDKMPGKKIPGGIARTAHARGMPERYQSQSRLGNEVVLIFVLFMLLVIVLLYFS